MTIDASDSSDTVKNYYAVEESINTGTGNDTIQNAFSGSNFNRINGGDGDDYISMYNPGNLTHGNYNTISGGRGNDTIKVDGTERTTNTIVEYADGDGDDVINSGYFSSYKIKLTSGTLRESLQSGSDIILKVGTGSITLKNVANSYNLSVNGNIISVDSKNATQQPTVVSATEAMKSDSIYRARMLVNGSAYDDRIYSMNDENTINAGDGNDWIQAGAHRSKINGGNGNDYIHDNYSNTFNSIDGGAGSDLITISGPATARGGTGDDTIYGVDQTGIFSVERNTRLYQYNAGDGNDIIFGYNERSSLKIRGEAYSTQKSGSDVIITVGNGSITLAGAATLSDLHISGQQVGDSENPWFVTLSEDADTYSNTVEDATIAALAGNDRISNTANNVSISTGAGDDTVTNSGKNVTISTGASNDSVRNVGSRSLANISTGDGNDTVYNGAYGENATINTGNGSDFVYNGLYSSGSKISLGAGNDTLVSDWSTDLKINGGAGNDSINLDVHARGAVIEYASGDGNDTISGFNPTDTLSLTGGSITGSVISGDDLILKVGTGSITLLNTRSVNVNGKIFNPTSTEGTSGHDFLTNFDDNATLNGYGGSDKLANAGNNVLINTGDGDNSVGSYGDRATIAAGNGNDTIYNDGMGSKIVAGAGNDSIHNGWTSATIDAGDGNDTIVNYYISSLSGGAGDDVIIDNYGNPYSTINGGKGDDTIYAYSSWEGTTTFEYGKGDGNDIVYGFGATDTLKIGNGTTDTYSRATVGNDIIVNVGDGSVKLVNAARLSTVNILGTKGAYVPPVSKLVTLSENDDTYSNTVEGATIQALGGDDTVTNRNNNVTIIGGEGDDSINNGGNSNVLFKYADGDGFDTVYGFNATSTLQIGGGTGTYSTRVSGNDIIVTVGDGSVLLKDAAGLSTVNIAGDEVTQSGGTYLRLDGTQAIYGTDDEVIFTIYGIGSNARLSDFVINGTTVTIGKGALDKGDLFLDSEDYTLKLASDVPISATQVNASWSALVNGKATFTAAAISDYYTLDDNSVTYSEGEGGETFTLTGIKSIAATAVEVDEVNKTVTLNAAALGNDNVTIESDDFSLALGDDVIQDPGDGDAKFISFDAGTAVYEVSGSEAYYTLDDDGVSFTPAGDTKRFTISGLANNLTLVNGEIGGIEVEYDGDEVKFILSTYALKNSNVTVTPAGATLELGDDVLQSAETIDGAWSEVTNGKATYSTNGKSKYYTLGGNQIVYYAAKAGNVELELAGLASTVTSDDDGFIDGLSVDENALTISGNIVDGNLVILRNDKNLSIDIAGDVENISVTGTNGADNFNVAGKNVTVIGSDGNDVVDMLGSGVLQYASGDGNDTLNRSDEYMIKITRGTVGKAVLDGDDVIIPVDNGSITIKDAKAQPINLIDADGHATVLVVDDPIARFLTYNDDKTAVTVAAEFDAGTLGANDYSSTVKTIVSSAVTEPIELFGNDNANLIVANDNANTIHGGKGSDTIIGGQNLSGDAGNDVFVYAQGDVTITDYSTGDKVSLDGAQISDVHISGDDIVLSFGDENSLTLQDVATKKITFVNDKTATQYLFADGTIFNAGKTTATLTASASKFNAGSYSSLVTIDGSNVDGQLQIVGNTKSNKIFAGDGGSTVNGGKGNDSLTGGNGADVFVYENKSGNDVIANFGAGDKISLGTGASVSSFAIDSKGDVTFKVGSNKLTVKNPNGQEITIVDAAGNESSANYYADRIVKGDGTTLVSAFKDKTFTAPTGTKTVDASDVSKSFALTGNDSDNVLIGGNGVQTLRGDAGNDSLTGGNGNDVFIYERGDDTITDYATGEKISLTSAAKNFRTEGDDVIIDFAEGSLTIKDAAGKKIKLIENGKSTVNVFAANGILNTAGTAITLGASAQTYTAAGKVATIDGSIVDGQIQIVGNTKANKIFAGNFGSTLSGGNGKDTLTGGDGSDVFVYEKGSGNKVIQSYGAGDKISIVGAAVTNISTSGGNTILKIGNNSITVKGASDVSFVDSDGAKTFSNGLIYGANGSVTIPASFKQNTTTPLELSASIVDASADKNPLNIKSTSTAGASIHGGTKNDTITGSAKSDTLYGGKGTDSLWGAGGSDTFVYEKGDGKDFIFGFGNDDLLEIVGLGQKVTGTFNKSGDELTVKAGSTTVAVFKDFSATTFNVTADGTNYQLKK